MLKKNNIYFDNIGKTQDNYFEVKDEFKLTINDILKLNCEWSGSF